MSAVFSSSPDADSTPAFSMLGDSADVSCRTEPQQHVGAPLTDAAREDAIKTAGKLFLRYMAKYEATGDFQYRGDADRALRLQSLLIQGRSPEQVARMEKERGLA